jgi:hypothetical protein
MPLHVAARTVGTSSVQVRRRARRDAAVRARLEEAMAEHAEAFRDLLRDMIWFHVFEAKDYKATRDQALINLPEWEVHRTQRFEVAAVESEALKLAAQKAFEDIPREELEAIRDAVRARNTPPLELLPEPPPEGEAA